MPAASAQSKTILIVEDNELNMKLFNDLLEANGYRVLQTRDGLSALDIARKHMPDLILMDIQLPEVSGIEVTKWLKEDDELKIIPVIAVTAFAMKGDEEKIREGGCEAYISKPISVLSFLQMVDSFLKRPQYGSGPRRRRCPCQRSPTRSEAVGGVFRRHNRHERRRCPRIRSARAPRYRAARRDDARYRWNRSLPAHQVQSANAAYTRNHGDGA
jgi:two-component system cell cycle response regulator DivK